MRLPEEKHSSGGRGEKIPWLQAIPGLFRSLRNLFHHPVTQEQRDTAALYDRVKKAFDRSVLAKTIPADLACHIALSALEEAGHKPSIDLLRVIYEAVLSLILEDGLLDFPKANFSRTLGIDEAVLLRKKLHHQEYFLREPDRSLARWRELTRNTFAGILDNLPPYPDSEGGDSFFWVSLIDLLQNPAQVMDSLFITTLSRSGEDAKLFWEEGLRNRLEQNLLRISGIDPNSPGKQQTPVLPSETRGKTLQELIDNYLAGTAFQEFFKAEIPFPIPFRSRFEHFHIVAGSGHGKTQLLQYLIHEDLARDASLCVIDSQGDLIANVSRLEAVNDRLVLIDPTDIEHPPALNLFDVSLEGDRVERERILNGTLALYEYLFGGILGAELTQRQGTIFGYLARLMLSIPGATIHTLIDIMEHGEKYRSHMRSLEGTASRFFDTQFFHRKFNATKDQIISRLYGILEIAALDRMFSHEKNKVNLFDEMNSGKIILVNTAKDFLQQEGCSIFGRFFIAMILQAAIRRSGTAPEERKDCLVFIDEAYDYFDEKVEMLFNQARKYRVGLTIAHQNLGQLSPKLKDAIMASSSIKFAGGVNADDARDFGREMHCDTSFLQSMRRYADGTEFACFVRNVTSCALKVSVPFGVMESLPKTSEEEYRFMLEENRRCYCEKRVEAPVPPRGVEAPEEARTQEIPPSPPKEPSNLERVKIPEREIREPAVEAPKPEIVAPVETPAPEIPASLETTEPKAPKPKRERKAKPVRKEPPPLGRGGPIHQYLQSIIKQFAEERNFRADIEKQILEGAGSVDVSLEKETRRIACEISVTTPAEHEFGNVTKCFSAGYDTVIVLSQDSRQSGELKDSIEPKLTAEQMKKVRFFAPEDFVEYLYLEEAEAETPESEKRVKGYKVKVKGKVLDEEERKTRREAIVKIISESMKRLE